MSADLPTTIRDQTIIVKDIFTRPGGSPVPTRTYTGPHPVRLYIRSGAMRGKRPRCKEAGAVIRYPPLLSGREGVPHTRIGVYCGKDLPGLAPVVGGPFAARVR